MRGLEAESSGFGNGVGLGTDLGGFPRASKYCVSLPLILQFYATKLQFPESNTRIIP